MPSRDDELAELAIALFDISRELQLRSATAGREQLTRTEGMLMRYVHRHPGCSPSQAAAATGLQRAKVSTTVRRLRERGLLDTAPAIGDGRGIRIRTTARADENLAQLRAEYATILRGVADGVSAEEASVLRTTLEEFAAALAQAPRS